jgi:hypothetical protein
VTLSPLPITDADVAKAFAEARPLTENEARHDLERRALSFGAKPDGFYSARWRWSVADVATLRGSDWRTRDALPTRRGR